MRSSVAESLSASKNEVHLERRGVEPVGIRFEFITQVRNPVFDRWVNSIRHGGGGTPLSTWCMV